MAVGGQVVTAEHRVRSDPLLAALGKTFDKETDGAGRRVRIGKIGCNRGMLEIQTPGHRVKAISLLADGERDDLDGLVGEIVEHVRATLGRAKPVHRRADDLCGVALCVANDDRVETILFRQRFHRIG